MQLHGQPYVYAKHKWQWNTWNISLGDFGLFNLQFFGAMKRPVLQDLADVHQLGCLLQHCTMLMFFPGTSGVTILGDYLDKYSNSATFQILMDYNLYKAKGFLLMTSDNIHSC